MVFYKYRCLQEREMGTRHTPPAEVLRVFTSVGVCAEDGSSRGAQAEHPTAAP